MCTTSMPDSVSIHSTLTVSSLAPRAMARSSDEAAPVTSEEQTLKARGELFPVQ